MKAFYDLHMHSCLSPCGDPDMTPNNIVGMSTLLGLNLIALTDHNTCQNCPAVEELGKANGICVLSGMELTTSEEIHVVCLFPTAEKALYFESFVSQHRMKIKNKKEIYGEQLILNAQDEKIGEIEELLILATDISIMDIKKLCNEYGGTAFPAHINRDSCSVLSVLGEIPPECNFSVAEVSQSGDIEKLTASHPILKNMYIIRDSDAHYLENMRDAGPYIEIDELTAENVMNFLEDPLK